MYMLDNLCKKIAESFHSWSFSDFYTAGDGT